MLALTHLMDDELVADKEELEAKADLHRKYEIFDNEEDDDKNDENNEDWW